MYMYIIHVYTHCNDMQSKSILQKYILLQLSCPIRSEMELTFE